MVRFVIGPCGASHSPVGRELEGQAESGIHREPYRVTTQVKRLLLHQESTRSNFLR